MTALGIGVAFCVRLGIAAVLGSAAIDKARDLAGFAAVLARWLRGPHRRWARAVIAWEAALAGALVAGPWPRLTAGLAATTFTGFALATWLRVRRGHAGEPCGCGGLLGDGRTGPALIARNLAIAGAAGVAAVVGARAWPDDAAVLALVVIGAGLALALAREAAALRALDAADRGPR
jgi:Methylamine utilisation protein MauE